MSRATPSTWRLASDRQYNLDAHVLSFVHEFTINDLLVGANAVATCICRIRGRGNLDFAPLTIAGHKLAVGGKFLETLVDALLLDTALALDERRFFVGKDSAHE